VGFGVFSSHFAYVNGAVIDTTNNKVVGALAAPGIGIAVRPDGKYVYATSFGFARGTGRVLVTGTLTDKVVATLHAGDFPTAIAASPDGKHVYVTNDYQHARAAQRKSLRSTRRPTKWSVPLTLGFPKGSRSPQMGSLST
jgi:DNA-binding beta-propeller fold protein YncE